MSNETQSLLSSSVSLSTLIEQFRQRYPMGALVTELLTLHQGEYVVRALVQIGGTVWSTGMATASRVEIAEDRAQERALLHLGLNPMTNPAPSEVRSPSMSDFSGDMSSDVSGEVLPKTIHSGNGVSQSPPLPDLSATDATETKSKDTVASTSSVSTSSTSAPEFLESGQTLDLLRSLESSHVPLTEVDKPVSDLSSNLPDEDVSEPPASKKSKPARSTKSKEPEPAPPQPEQQDAQDYSDIIAKIDVEMMRLGWNASKGREHLKSVYGKRSRQQLSYPELLDFLTYLEGQP